MNEETIIKNPKTVAYGFQWRVVFSENLYILQRYSNEYKTWLPVKYLVNEKEAIKMYDRLQ